MKKLLVIFTVILSLFIMPISALAEEGSTPAGGTSLVIDNKNIYEGMDKAYKDGYTVAVKDGTARIVLPLIAAASIKDNTITAAADLGNTAGSPFVFKNYQKTVSLNSYTVSGGATVSAYLVRFDISLASGRANGVYPVAINIQGQRADGSEIQQTFTAYVTITDGKDASTGNTQTDKPTSQPKIIISGCSISPSPINAGNEFTAIITLKNTSTTKAVQNMMVTASCESPKLILENGSNTIFIDQLGAGKTKDISLKYKTDLDTPAQAYNISLALTYDNSEAAALTSAGTISVTINQPMRVQMEMPQIGESVNAGDTLPLSFQVMNLGRSKAYNVRCELNAPGLIPSGTAFIGNMEAGTPGKADINVFVGTKDMTKGYEGKDKYGATNGKMKLTYEDAEGKEYTQEVEFSTVIKEPVISTNNDKPEEEPKKAGQWWVSIVIGAIVIGGLAVVLIIRRKKEKYYEKI